ncbi:MAG: transcriptional regulator, LysR family [candidate division NC10 bacterium]|nr:transcriptional regulator, LysR family [candidate division NC10 bacterium]
MNLHQLRVFCEVANARSFTAAATKLHLTQPAATWQMKRLEEAYGLQFLQRAGKRVSLTEEGKVLLDFAGRILRLAGEAEEALADLRGLPLGTLRIDATYICGDYYLPALLEALHRRHPGIRFQIGIGNSSQVIENTLAQKNDIGICAQDPAHPKLEAHRIMSDLLVGVVGRTHPFARRHAIGLRELAGQPLILRETGSSPRGVVDEMLSRHGVVPTVIMESASTSAIKRFVENGVGMAILSQEVVRKELQDGSLRRVLFTDAEIAYHFYLIRHKDRWISRALSAFVEMARSFRLQPDAVPRPRRQTRRGRGR